jgi:hypothetical protein
MKVLECGVLWLQRFGMHLVCTRSGDIIMLELQRLLVGHCESLGL